MTAPAHLCGPMDRSTPWRLRLERYQWVVASREAGATWREIGGALGISHVAAHHIVARLAPRNPRGQAWSDSRDYERPISGPEIEG